jgi:coatomer subunit beta
VQVCRTKPADKSKYIKIILAMLSSTKPVVVYDCATLLTSLSQAPTAVRAAANCFCQLLVTHSDNNVKLIVLDRLSELKAAHTDVLSEVLMDIMRALSTPSFDICRKILDLAMDLITPRNINEVWPTPFFKLIRHDRLEELKATLVYCRQCLWTSCLTCLHHRLISVARSWTLPWT